MRPKLARAAFSLATIAALCIIFAAYSSWLRRSSADSYCPAPTAGTTVTCTYAAAVSAHDVLRVCVADFSGKDGSAISDSVNGSTGWSAEEASFHEGDNGSGHARCFYNKDTLAGTPVVSVTMSGSTSPVVRMFAYSGLDNSAPLVTSVTHSAVSSSTGPSCDAVTPTAVGQLMANTFIVFNDLVSIDPNNGETEIYDDAAFQGQDKASTSTSAFQSSWSLSAARSIGCASAIYKLASTGTANPLRGPLGGAPLTGPL